MMSRDDARRSQSTQSPLEGSVYLHWPFCRKRCTYCNFNKYIPKASGDGDGKGRQRPAMDQGRMRACLVAELENSLFLSGIERVPSVFFGGGTPSLMEPKTVKVIREIVFETLCIHFNCML